MSSSTVSIAKAAILTVEDDPGVHRAGAWDLRRRYGEKHPIVRAETGANALQAPEEMNLRGDEVAVLLADYRMPQISGLEFLERAMDLFPWASRVLLTAYAVLVERTATGGQAGQSSPGRRGPRW